MSEFVVARAAIAPAEVEGIDAHEARLAQAARRSVPALPAADAVAAVEAGMLADAVPAAPRNENSAAAAENELASRPMLQLPAQAAQPQALTTQTAGPAITLPLPTQTAGRWIPGGFPATAEGALAQLKALDETGMRGGDPQIYGYETNTAETCRRIHNGCSTICWQEINGSGAVIRRTLTLSDVSPMTRTNHPRHPRSLQ